jgi:replication factor C small subunit
MIEDFNVFTERYRPNTVKNVISPHKEKILEYLKQPQALPNFLFYSTIGGTGKSSMLKAIVKDLGCDVLYINASADRSIENIRTTVRDFARTKSTNGLKRIVCCEEFEKITKDASDALKNMIEDYAENCMYIATTNNINKINQPMQSRFVCLEFSQPSKEDILNYLKMICDTEKMNYDIEAIKKLIDINYPSIRNCVKQLQDLYIQKKKVSLDVIKKNDSVFEDLWNKIKLGKFPEVRIYIIENGVDCKQLNKWIFDNIFFDNIEEIKLKKIIQLLSRNERDLSLSADPQIIFIATMLDIIDVLK